MNCNEESCTPVSHKNPAAGAAELPVAAPRVDAWSDDEGERLLVDLPGVPRENLEIVIDGTTLTVSGTAVAPTIAGRAVHTEWRPVRYVRRFELPPRADAQAVRARLEAGVLHIAVPRSALTRRRVVPVGDAD
jgi:HSP20 family molecular chaperone IbpA